MLPIQHPPTMTPAREIHLINGFTLTSGANLPIEIPRFVQKLKTFKDFRFEPEVGPLIGGENFEIHCNCELGLIPKNISAELKPNL